MKRGLFALVCVCALAAALRADEIRLKDGSKINGSIVGYEDGSFKVETAYGFAMIRKDSIAEIVPAEPKQTSATKASTNKPATSLPDKIAASDDLKPQPVPIKSTAPVGSDAKPLPAAISKAAPTAPESIAKTTGGTPPHPVAKTPNSASTPAPATVAASPVAAPAAPPVAPPPTPPPPPVVQEAVRGNLYTNQTYGFQMYKPPDWQVIAEARAALPNAIAAMGTSDQSTLFVVGRDRAHDALEEHSAATEKALREVYENYRPLPSVHTTIGGSPAIERRFRGAAENRDWSVFLVTLIRGEETFTILAMTDANSDLVQLQENVIAKTIASLQFTAPHI